MPDHGFDLSGIDDITPSMVAVGGRLVLVQALCRRLMTPRGRLFYDSEYGYDLRELMSAAIISTSEISFRIEEELLKDDRVFDVVAKVTRLSDRSLRIGISVTDDAGPVSFVLAVDDVTVALLRQQQ
jgi:hypothetical protein